MGIVIPDDDTIFDPDAFYFVVWSDYRFGGCDVFFATRFNDVSGATLNAYYNAGGDCKGGNCPAFCNPGHSAFIVQANLIPEL